jgi:hypothetical protein
VTRTDTAPAAAQARAFWEHPLLLAALVLAATVPVLLTDVPPLTDLPSHMGRYRVQLGIDSSPWLHRYFGFEWGLIGNLGVDLLIIPMAKLFGLELGVKLIVAAIPALTVAGLLLVAREVHGRIPSTAFFVLPVAYSFPFQFGFVNFALSVALALLAFALWVRLGRADRDNLRALLFIPLSCLIWVCHTFGWGLLGVLAFAAETAAHRARGASLPMSAVRGAFGCLPLTPPVLLMLLWRSGTVSGRTLDWFNWPVKLGYVLQALRERWIIWDMAGVALLVLLPFIAPGPFRHRFDRTLGLAAFCLAAVYILLPRILFGSAYADMRLAPFMLAAAVLSIRAIHPDRMRMAQWIAAAGILFFATRLAVTAAAFVQLDRGYDRQLAAVEHIAPGSRVLIQANIPCQGQWNAARLDHLGSMAIVRRDAFTNDQFAMAGAQLLKIRYRGGSPWINDPSQMVRPRHCDANVESDLGGTLSAFPRHAFDYLWMMDFPRELWPRRPDLIPVWQGEAGVLYRVDASATAASDTPKGRVPLPTR